MTHVIMIDDSESPAKGTEVSRAVTVLEIPKVHIYGIRFYKTGYLYKEILGEVYDQKIAQNVGIKTIKDNNLETFKSKIDEFSDITALAYLDAGSLEFGNKRVLRFEVPVGGADNKAKVLTLGSNFFARLCGQYSSDPFLILKPLQLFFNHIRNCFRNCVYNF